MAGRTFELHRAEDVSGVTGAGVVADGVEFPDDTVVIHWRGEPRSTAIWADLSDAIRVNGHEGRTIVVWDDES